MKRKIKSWYKPKGYIHFSPKLGKEQKVFVQNYILNKLDKHNYFPLIHETLTARRYKAYLDDKSEIYHSHFDTVKHKPSKKPREIFYANHLDAQIYSYYSNEIFGKKYENLLARPENKKISEAVISYRKILINPNEIDGAGKCNIHFADELFKEIKQRENCVVACYDIENFFPSLNHEYLKSCVKELIGIENYTIKEERLINSLINYSYVEMKDIVVQCTNNELGIKHKNDLKKSDFDSYFINAKDFREKIAKNNLIRKHRVKNQTDILKGIPQGTPISAFLANLYLLKFDRYIVENLVHNNYNNCFYRRYSDDIAIIFNNFDEFKQWNEEIIKEISLEPLSLKINDSKTVVSIFSTIENKITCKTKTELNDNYSENHKLKYLGFEYGGENILIKSSSLSKFYREMKMSIRRKANRANSAKRHNKRYPKKKPKDIKLYLTKIYSRFSHLGKNKAKSNFLTYSERASETIYPNIKGKENPIKRQLIRAWSIFEKSISKYEKKPDNGTVSLTHNH